MQEREAKIELMKKRVRERDGVSSDEEQKDKDRPSSSQTPKSINFFSDLEQGVCTMTQLHVNVVLICILYILTLCASNSIIVLLSVM